MPASTSTSFRFPHNVQAVLQQIRQGLGIQAEQQQLGDAVALLDDRDRWVEDELSAIDGRVQGLEGAPAVVVPPGVPPGGMVDFAGATAPAGWLVCNGAAVLRADYPDLFSAIGTVWGAGNGTTTFNLPDLRGRTAIGSGQGSGLTNRTLGGKAGEENHVLTVPELALHDHTYTAAGANVTFAINDGSGFPTGTQGITTGFTGGNVGHNTMQPYAVVNKIIKT